MGFPTSILAGACGQSALVSCLTPLKNINRLFEIPKSRIVDDLWNNKQRRRQIRLAQWSWATYWDAEDICDSLESADILHTYRSASFTPKEDELLSPHKELLTRIFKSKLSKSEKKSIPAITYVETSIKELSVGKAKAAEARSKNQDTGKSSKAIEEYIKAGQVMDAGDLCLEEQQRAANWISRNIPGASVKGHELNWIGKPTLAHAFTILLSNKHWEAIRKKLKLSDMAFDGLNSDSRALSRVWKAAFAVQTKTPPLKTRFVDVDKECIADLERRVFEFSSRSGRAGNRQWGLDVGPCEDQEWFTHVPADWTEGVYDPSINLESDLETGTGYRHQAIKKPEVAKKSKKSESNVNVKDNEGDTKPPENRPKRPQPRKARRLDIET